MMVSEAMNKANIHTGPSVAYKIARIRIKELEQQTAELEAELADTVTECLAAKSNEDIMRKQLAELEALITPSDTKPGPAPESSQEAPEKT